MVGDRCERSIAADDRKLVHLQVNVARALFHGTPKDCIQLHALHIGSGWFRL
jgi:hypothetical protein